MSATVIFVVISLVLLASFAVLALRRTRALAGYDSPAALVVSLALGAFRNLVDPKEEAILRAHLPRGKFNNIQRERAALAYVQELSRAALQFTRMGDMAQRSPDPEVCRLGVNKSPPVQSS